MPGGSNLGQMASIISALAGIQSQKRELELRTRQLDQSADQFSKSMGFEEKSSEQKRFTELVKQIADSSTKTRTALLEVGKASGMNDDEMKALQTLAANAPETLQAIQQNAVGAARQAQNPQQQASQNQEIASQALTGMNTGQAANSGLQAILAGGAQRQVTPAMQQGYAQRAATNQTPLDAIIQATIAQNPDMRGRMAGVTAGTAMTAGQESQADIGRGGVTAELTRIADESKYHQMEIAERLATAKTSGSLSPQLEQSFGRLNELLKTAGDGKIDSAVRRNAMALYNNLARTMGLPETSLFKEDDAGGPAGAGARFQNSLGFSTMPPVGQPVPQLQPQNPLQQFVRPPQ